MALSKKQISLVRSLGKKKYRQQHGLFVAEGEKVVTELLASDYKIEAVYATGAYNELATRVSEKELAQISQLKSPNKVLAMAHIPQGWPLNLSNGLTIALDTVNDPGNLGTILRIADWFGVKQVLCSDNSVDVYNPKVVQSAMGSLFRVQVACGHLEEELTKAKQENIPVFAASMQGDSLYETPLPEKAILLFGSESHGLQQNLLQLADKNLTIPGQGEAESLNVAVAAAVFCSEWARVTLQR